ncbi:MAG: hypothetical protein ACTSYQ_02200 [Candidatus Odinarchaeia archaeon]
MPASLFVIDVRGANLTYTIPDHLYLRGSDGVERFYGLFWLQIAGRDGAGYVEVPFALRFSENDSCYVFSSASGAPLKTLATAPFIIEVGWVSSEVWVHYNGSTPVYTFDNRFPETQTLTYYNGGSSNAYTSKNCSFPVYYGLMLSNISVKLNNSQELVFNPAYNITVLMRVNKTVSGECNITTVGLSSFPEGDVKFNLENNTATLYLQPPMNPIVTATIIASAVSATIIATVLILRWKTKKTEKQPCPQEENKYLI